jgi:hypothetical protein
MKSMKYLLVVAALGFAALTHAKTFPDPTSVPSNEVLDAKLPAVTYTLDIKWVRADSPVAEFRDGTCYVYVSENFDDERSLYPMGERLEQCIAKGARVVNDKPIAGARRVSVYIPQGDVLEVTRIIESIYGHSGGMMISAKGRVVFVAARLTVAGGVYFDPDAASNGTCRVVVHSHYQVGHEVKHCFDGQFHDNRWNWLKADH